MLRFASHFFELSSASVRTRHKEKRMALIECENLTLGYEGEILIENLSFSVNQGDYLCIVGENGSGKTTLMKTLLHLRQPMSGKVREGDGLAANEIGYLPQQTLVQRDFPASVNEIVISGFTGRMGLRPFHTRQEKDLARENMRRMGIEDLGKRCYRDLSGGQQQRVLLARALCATEKVLLLDEPVSGLDPKAAADMYRLIADLNRNDRITIIMVSHDIDMALAYATHILHVGKTVFYGTREAYLESPAGAAFSSEEESPAGGQDGTGRVRRQENG